jgi:hypothetical protein
MKTDGMGNLEWSRTFGGEGDDEGSSVQQTSNGGYIIVGSTTSFGAGSEDGYLIKTDETGNEVWSRTFGGRGWDSGTSVIQTLDGGYIITGSRSNRDVWVIKLSPSPANPLAATMSPIQTNPSTGFILAPIPFIFAMFKVARDRRRKKITIRPIEDRKFNALVITHLVVILGLFYLFLSLTLGEKGDWGHLNVATISAYTISILTIFGIVSGYLFLKRRLVKSASYFSIALFASLVIFASFPPLYSIIKSIYWDYMADILRYFSLPLLLSLTDLYVNRRYGEILIVTGEMAKVPTTPVFPAELNQVYSDPEYIGGGGFAWVFQATRSDGEKVAIKIPAIKDEKTGKFFISEVANWSTLDHENIVRLNSFNIYPHPYLEMELCDGGLEPGKRDIGEAAWITYEVAKGLRHAHERNIVHGDIKHANILVKDGKLKISDWGLSKVKRGKSLSVSALTPEFAAPEQIIGKADERTDIWQLGVVFYELVTGKFPFKGEYGEVVNQIINVDPTRPSEINPEAKSVEPIIIRCLRKEKEERYQMMKELMEELEKYSGERVKTKKAPWIGDTSTQVTPLQTRGKCTSCGYGTQPDNAICPSCGEKIRG